MNQQLRALLRRRMFIIRSIELRHIELAKINRAIMYHRKQEGRRLERAG